MHVKIINRKDNVGAHRWILSYSSLLVYKFYAGEKESKT